MLHNLALQAFYLANHSIIKCLHNWLSYYPSVWAIVQDNFPFLAQSYHFHSCKASFMHKSMHWASHLFLLITLHCKVKKQPPCTQQTQTMLVLEPWNYENPFNLISHFQPNHNMLSQNSGYFKMSNLLPINREVICNLTHEFKSPKTHSNSLELRAASKPP